MRYQMHEHIIWVIFNLVR